MSNWRKRLEFCRERFLLVVLLGTPEVAELVSAASLGLFGVWMLLTGDLFSRYPVFFRSMSAIAPEWGWAVFLMAVASGQLLAVATGSRDVVRRTAMAATAVCVFLAVMFIQGDWRAPTTGLFIAGAISNVWVFLRTSPWWNSGGADAEP